MMGWTAGVAMLLRMEDLTFGDYLVLIGIGALGWGFAFIVVPRVNRRLWGSRYKTGSQRMWSRHPGWMVVAGLTGLVIAITTTR